MEWFWQFFNGGKKRKPLFGNREEEGGKAIYLSPWGSICFPEKLCHEIESPDPCGGYSLGADTKRMGPNAACGHHRDKEEGLEGEFAVTAVCRTLSYFPMWSDRLAD